PARRPARGRRPAPRQGAAAPLTPARREWRGLRNRTRTRRAGSPAATTAAGRGPPTGGGASNARLVRPSLPDVGAPTRAHSTALQPARIRPPCHFAGYCQLPCGTAFSSCPPRWGQGTTALRRNWFDDYEARAT